MACKVAENIPLSKLRDDLGLPYQCHSLREDCIHNYTKPSGNYTMGIPGAAIGYCQALFNNAGNPEAHTNLVIDQLTQIDAPWLMSHELFWGYNNNETADSFVSGAIKPLLGEGRVPILITSLNPAKDLDEIKDITETQPPIFPGETALLRVVIDSDESIDNSIKIMKETLDKSRSNKEMPKWWLLLQGEIEEAKWIDVKNRMGEDWKYVNIAVNPFTYNLIPGFCLSQVTVAQVVVGHKSGIYDDGVITISEGMKISGAKEGDTYNIFRYFNELKKLILIPTLIVLGPSLPNWTVDENKERLNKLIPLLKSACNELWSEIGNRRDVVWELKA